MIKEINEMDEFLDILKNFDVSINSYMTYDYFVIYSSYYKDYVGKFTAFLVFDNNEIIGIIPLIKRKLDYIILGYRASNYLGYICTNEKLNYVDLQFRKYLKSKNIVITYYDINSYTKLYTLLRNDKYCKMNFLYNCPYCKVNESFDELFKRQIKKSKKRTELRKFKMKLNLVGNIQILHIDTYEKWEKYKVYFNQIFSIHRERFAHVFVDPKLSLSSNEIYYTKLFERLIKVNKVYISLMLVDETVISFVYTIISDGVIMDWMPAFDPAFKKYNLGTIHLMEIIKYACESDRYRVFDFSKGDGIYKERWANGQTENYVFVRRFNDSIISKFKQKIARAPISIKSGLRKRGTIGRIKKFLGTHKRERSSNILENEESIISYCNSVEEFEGYDDFKYALLKKYSIKIRQEILNFIYDGIDVKISSEENKIEKIFVNKSNKL